MPRPLIFLAISHSFCANFIRGQAQFLSQNGYSVIIVSADGPEVREVALTEGARLIVIPFSREISVFNDFKCLLAVIRLIKQEKPAIINAGNPKTGLLFMIAGVFFPSVYKFFTLRGLRSDTLSGIKRTIVAFTEWISCRLADRVIAISPSLKKHAATRGILSDRKAIVINKGSSNGINISKYKTSNELQLESTKLRQSIGLSNEDLVIGYVGRITKDKGIEELYHAFQLCCRKNRDIKLVLVGPVENDDPISNATMDELLKDQNVFLLGNRSDTPTIYTMIDMLVLYSYREGFGNVVLEASSMECPVIVSDIPGARDTVDGGVTGLLVEPRNARKLSEAIMYYVSNPEEMRRHGTNGAKRVREDFSSERIWKGQLALYNDVLN